MPIFTGVPGEELYNLQSSGFTKLLTKDVPPPPPPNAKHGFTDTPGSLIMGMQGMGGSQSFGHQFITVEPGQEIQTAIDKVASAGGGVVRLLAERYRVTDHDIIVPSNVTLRGEGRDNTAIDFRGTGNKLRVYTPSGTVTSHPRLEHFAVIASNGIGGIDIGRSQGTYLDNVVVTNCEQNGIYIHDGAQFVTLHEIIADTNLGSGILISNDDPNNSVLHIKFINAISQENSDNGVEIVSSATFTVATLDFVNCRFNLNTNDGVDISGGQPVEVTFNACFSASNSGIGFDSAAEDVTFIACTADTNTGDGFEVSDFDNRIIGCRSKRNTGKDWDLQVRTTFLGNNLDWGETTPPNGDLSTATLASSSDMIGNLGTSPSANMQTVRVQNVHGSTVGNGKTVVYADGTDQLGYQIEASFTAGDDRVLGVLIDSLDDDEYGSVQTRGFTDILQVNGTTDIAVGDLLSLHSANAVAAKALDGHMAFAIALEAYTTNDSSGVIDALLIEPRKVGAGVPQGGIILWSGTIASIPSGFVICDGNNSTPNLVDKFIIGVATAATNPADGGGSHTLTSGTSSDNSQLVAESPSPPTNGVPTPSHTHTVTATGVKHYRVAFIMKS